MNPTELLHTHHLSRQIGRLHERINDLDGFKQDAVHRLDGQANDQKVQELSEDIQSLRQDMMLGHKELKKSLQNVDHVLVEDITSLHKDNGSLLQTVQEISNAQNDTEIILSNRLDAVEQAQGSMNAKLDSTHQLLLTLSKSNENITKLISELLKNQKTNQEKESEPCPISSELVAFSSDSTTKLIRSSPPLPEASGALRSRPAESDNILSALNSEHGMFKPVKRSRVLNPKDVDDLLRSGMAWRSGSSRIQKPRKVNPPRRQIPPHTPKSNGLMGFGFVVVGEPHELHQKDRKRR